MQLSSRWLSVGIALTSIMPLFCCGIPALVSVVTLVTTFGLLSASSAAQNEIFAWFLDAKPIIVGVSVALVGLGWWLRYQNIKALAERPCCQAKAKKFPLLLTAATLLCLFNLAVVILT